MKIYFFLIFVSCSSLLYAQLPQSNLYLFDLQINEKQVLLSNPIYLTHNNANGYNNQPSFLDNTRFLYISDKGRKGKTDIYLGEIPGKVLKRFTATEADEYSPRLHSDNKNVNCIRVNPNDNTIQELWQYPYDRSSEGGPMFESIKNAGYYLRKSEDSIAVFLVDERNVLITITGKNKRKYEVSRDIGRCLSLMPEGKLVFVHKLNSQYWYLKTFDWEYRTNIIAQMPEGVEDFVVLNNGSILCAKESELLLLPLNSSEWSVVFTLENFGLNSLNRIAVNQKNDKIIIVNQKQ